MSLHNILQIKNQKALKQLTTLKPYDGWSLESYVSSASNKTLIMLKRRNVPLYKKGFEFIYYDESDSKNIVGITSIIGDTDNSIMCKGTVLVDHEGNVVREEKEVKLQVKKMEKYLEKEINEAKISREKNIKNTKEAQKNNEGSREPVLPGITDEQTSELAKLGLFLIGGLTILRIVSSLFFSVNFVLMPLIVLYAMSTCPENSSFDAKKELKRVLRGHHLPENHPDKPKKDWFSDTIARVTASVATELATSLGYELSFFNVFGICNFVTVDVQVLNQELYWIGIVGSWRYLLKREKVKPE